MRFHLHHHPRSREETRARIAEAVTEMACRIDLETLETTLRTARACRSGTPVTLAQQAQVEALALNGRHLARNIDTILMTNGLPEAQRQPVDDVPVPRRGPCAAAERSHSVAAIIHKFSTLSAAFTHLHGPSDDLSIQDGEQLCDEPAAT